MKDQLGEYLSQERGRAQAGAQKFLLVLGAVPLALLLITSILMIAWVLIFYGITEALAQALGGKTWLAACIVGGAVLLLAILAGLLLWQWTHHRVKRAKRRARAARDALWQSFQQTENSVKQMASLQVWTERYPMQVTGVALLAGFALSGPLTDRAPSPAAPSDAPAGPPSPVFDRMQIWATMINAGAEILKDVLTPMLQDMIQPKKAKSSSPDSRSAI